MADAREAVTNREGAAPNDWYKVAESPDWGSLEHVEDAPKEKFDAEPAHDEHEEVAPEKPETSLAPIAPEALKNPESTAEKEKSFTERELERIANLTGRVPDDPEVIKLNLVLRYQKFQQYRDLYDDQKSKHIMIQKEVYEDIATAKRELKEAMYLYDDSFDKFDGRLADLNEQQRRHNLKDYQRQDRHFGTGEAITANSWVKAYAERKKTYDGKRNAIELDRQAAANKLYNELGKISADIREDEIFKTYELYKDKNGEQPISERRNGYDAGGKNLFITDKDGHMSPEQPVDWEFFPHVEAIANASNKPSDSPDKPNNPDAPNNPDKDNPDKDNPDNKDNSGKDNPDDENGPDDKDTLLDSAKDTDLDKIRQKELENARAKELEYSRMREKEFISAKELEIANMTEAERNARLAEIIEQRKSLDMVLSGTEQAIETRKALDKEMAEFDAKTKEILKTPLVAVNADFTLDKQELAHDLAERELNEEVSKSGLIKKIWKGNLFKKVYETRYTKELIEGDRKVAVNGKELSVDEIMAGRKDSAISRFVMRVVDNSKAYIHTKAGEKMTEADEKTTKLIRRAIERFATAEVTDDVSEADIERAFKDEIERIKGRSRDTDDGTDELLFDNYFDVAMQARKRADFGISIDRVMEGFKVYDATVRDGIRTEAHRTNTDKIINKLEGKGLFVAAEAVALATASYNALTQTGVRALAGAGAGIALSSVLAGYRERNRVTEDRARMMRDVANGMNYGKDMSKYEQRIGGTLYVTEKATKLTSDIEKAVAGEGDLLKAIARARVHINYSDSQKKDLISYSSEDNRGKERLDLDIATIRAEKSLSDEDRQKLATIEKQLLRDIFEKVDEKDTVFKRERAKLAVKKAGKSLLVGSLVFLGSQEVMAAMDPGKVGILEKYGVLDKFKNTEFYNKLNNQFGFELKENTNDASETLLASHFGTKRGSTFTTEEIRVSDDDIASIEKYRGYNFDEAQITEPSVETVTDYVEISPSSSPNQVRAIIDGYANNGTPYADGNELSLHVGKGNLYTTMHGVSSMGTEKFDIDALAASNQVKGYVTIGGARFEVAFNGNNAWGENGILTTTTGENIRCFTDSGAPTYDLFQIAIDRGTDADGFTHIVPIASHVGSGSFKGTITSMVEVPKTVPGTIAFYRTIESGVPRAIDMQGVAFTASGARQGLSGPNQSNAPRKAPGRPVMAIPTPDIEPVAPIRTTTAPTESTEPAPVHPAPTEPPAPEITIDTTESSAAEPAPTETTDSAPESSHDEPTKEPEQKSSRDEKSDALWQEAIEKHASGVPKEAIEFLSRPDSEDLLEDDIASGERVKNYVAWWDKQSESVRQAVGKLVKFIFDANKQSLLNHGDVISKFGNSFMNWMRTNHGGYLS